MPIISDYLAENEYFVYDLFSTSSTLRHVQITSQKICPKHKMLNDDLSIKNLKWHFILILVSQKQDWNFLIAFKSGKVITIISLCYEIGKG